MQHRANFKSAALSQLVETSVDKLIFYVHGRLTNTHKGYVCSFLGDKIPKKIPSDKFECIIVGTEKKAICSRILYKSMVAANDASIRERWYKDSELTQFAGQNNDIFTKSSNITELIIDGIDDHDLPLILSNDIENMCSSSEIVVNLEIKDASNIADFVASMNYLRENATSESMKETVLEGISRARQIVKFEHCCLIISQLGARHVAGVLITGTSLDGRKYNAKLTLVSDGVTPELIGVKLKRCVHWTSGGIRKSITNSVATVIALQS